MRATMCVFAMGLACGGDIRVEMAPGEAGGSTSTGATALPPQTDDVDGTTASTEGGSSSGTSGGASSGGDDESSSSTGEPEAQTKCPCEPMVGDNVWIPNTWDGTISKIDAAAATEVGRYRTDADGLGRPGAVAVSPDGRAAVVANVFGSVAMIWAREEDCFDADGDGAITTSTGPADVLAFGEDECLAWSHAWDESIIFAPWVAWVPGEATAPQCAWPEPKVFVAVGLDGLQEFGIPNCQTDLRFARFDALTGVLEDELTVPEDELSCGGYAPVAWGTGVDARGGAWLHNWHGHDRIRVDVEALTWEAWAAPSLDGITVGSGDQVWSTGGLLRRFDPETGTTSSTFVTAAPTHGGLAEDRQGRIWIPSPADRPPGVVSVDRETLAVGTAIDVPSATRIVGISVDGSDNVWGVPGEMVVSPVPGVETRVFRIDPTTEEVDVVDGIAASVQGDMTGSQLRRSVCALR